MLAFLKLSSYRYPCPQLLRATPTPSVAAHGTVNTERSQLYTEILKGELAILTKQVEVSKNIRQKLNNKKITSTPMSRQLNGSVLIHAPKCGLDIVEVLIHLSISVFLVDILLVEDIFYLLFICSSKSTLKEIMIDETCTTIVLERKEMKCVLLSVLCDKGERQTKKRWSFFC